MVTVSLASWMDLPGYSIAEWLNSNDPELGRLPAFLIRKYMVAYAEHMGIAKNIYSFTKVSNISVFFYKIIFKIKKHLFI